MNIDQAQHSPQPASLDSPGAGGTFARALTRLVLTSDAIWPAILRVTLGGVLLPHALQKTLGWFGGLGFEKTMHWFTAQLHLPVTLALLVIFTEQTASLALLIGFCTRAAALGVAAVMVGAVLTVHLQNGFFMNWFGNQPGEGFEFHLLVLAIVVALLVAGGGRWSVDRALSRSERLPRKRRVEARSERTVWEGC